MCGIAGRVNFASGASPSAASVRAMCDLLAHRGPDGSGVVVRGVAGLGHRRLAIIDLSDAGRQPMSTEDGAIWVTFNGEIYNFRELRGRLSSLGHRFHTQTDTEVILAAYRQYGLDFLQHLNGMFAFALWDEPARTLVLARDRAGKKPLFYRQDADGMAFASEPKAFLADPSFRAEADPAAISEYLTYQYVPTPMSAFKGVRKLPPAHYLLVRDGRASLHRYWKLSYASKLPLREEEAVERLVELLRAAVARRLISDVPLGAFLSGGIDSGAVVALMAQETGRVKTFSIGFDDPLFDELQFARMVAERYGTDHHELVVRPDAVNLLPKLVWHYNEPFADSSAIPTFVLSEWTRRHVTVALNGDGGDESFAGYDRYRAMTLANRYDRAPRGVRRAVDSLASLVPASRTARGTLARGKRFLEGLREGPERRYLRWMAHFNDDLKRDLCTPDFLEAGGTPSRPRIFESYASADGPDLLDRTLSVDVDNYLPDDLLVKVDIATMAHGLEARSPLLDHEVMEFAAALPSSLKLRNGVKKYLLKAAVRDLLPQEIINRPKMGFGVPLESWFRVELKPVAYDVLTSQRFRERGYFRQATVQRLLDQHVAGIRAWHYQLWNLLMLELWHRAFIDGGSRGYEDVSASVGATIVA
jgi:asparagine synthase (glutamine-hydrolysing)